MGNICKIIFKSDRRQKVGFYYAVITLSETMRANIFGDNIKTI